MTTIENIKNRFDLLHPLNYMVEPSPLNNQWVRITSYPCCSMGPEDHVVEDFDAETMLVLIERCHDGADVEDLMVIPTPELTSSSSQSLSPLSP